MRIVPDSSLNQPRSGGRRAAALTIAAGIAVGLLAAATLAEAPAAGEEASGPQEASTAPEKSSTGPSATAPAKRLAATAPAKAASGSGGAPVAATAPAATTAPTSPPPSLSFSDDDLAKYHKAVPAEDEEADGELGGAGATTPLAAATGPKAPGAPASPAPGMTAPGSTGPAAVKTTPAAKPRPTPPPPGFIPEHAPLVRTPLVIAPAPGSDPLKPIRDREAKEKFRAGQLQALRDRIAPLQARLDYLNARRAAILNPLQIAPQPQSDEDKNREATLKPKDLLDQIDAEIKSVGDELKQAQDNLVELETRFGPADAR